MKNFPAISYVVKTQYVTNSAGLTTLYEKVFTDENIIVSRARAIEYYNATIEVLESIGEIFTDKVTNEIIYKNPQDYDKGITMEMRLNHVSKKTETDHQVCRRLVMRTHHHQCPAINELSEFNKEVDEILKQAPKKESVPAPFSGRRLVAVAELRKIKKQPPEKIEFIAFENREEDTEILLQSVCAFLNTNGGTVILGQSRDMDDESDDSIFGMKLTIKRLFASVFGERMEHITIQKKRLNSICFLEIQITKTSVKTFYQSHFYYRNCIGNVVDLDGEDF